MVNSTILIAEDDVTLSALYSGLFKDICKNVLVVHSGNEAISVLKDGMNNVDVVLSDVNMPDGTGQDLINFIATLSEKPPIVIVTAYSELKEVYSNERCIKVHQKPANMAEVITDIQLMLDSREDCNTDKVYGRLVGMTSDVDKFLATLRDLQDN